ncbi:hypothetical protein M2G92_21360 [Vibrio vulnificus]|uniref:lipopolysaccharide biosynthesis protein n=1 Tax=Vibrio vulnificus TaxID=672 RepID=UPI001A29DC6B|nr:hypothetical protein [Vibrio vulnificus]ELY5143594.1 hypothetical protein [Vibrio vulnificus]MCA0779104.1 hypothetical protein [Vibrio vulnificus]MCU8115778.1 hypothetical protein [Vibrio vulnificus]MCU8317781.1 hypothetical protein [Vibrio vulnificus]WIL74474.1 hypothetical protein QPX65_01165 [Vibrio vulnificus]
MKDFLKLLLYRGGAAIGTLLFTLYVYMFSSVEEASVIFSFVLLIYLLSMLSRIGLDIYIVKDASRMTQREGGRLFSKIITFICVFNFIISFALFFYYKKTDNSQEFLYLSLSMIPFSIWMPISCYFRTQGENFYSAIFEPGTIFLITTFFAYLLNELPMLDVFVCVNWFLFLIVFLYLIANGYYTFSFNCLHGWIELVKSGYGYMTLSIISYLTLWLPAFFIKSISPDYFVDYNLAVRLIAPFTFIITTVDFYLSTRFSRNYFESKYEEILKDITIFRKFFSIIGGLYLILTSSVLFIAEKYVHITSTVFEVYTIVLVGYIISSAIGPYGTLLNMANRVKYVNYGTAFALLVLVFFIYPVNVVFGMNGIVILISLSIVIRSLLIRYYSNSLNVLG